MLTSQYNFCKICGEEVKEADHYWTQHDLSQKKYFQKFYPKLNKLTNEPLEFKNKEQYLLNEFNNRSELQKWTKSVDKSLVYDYLVNYLNKRKELKGITNIPGFLESKTLIIPNPSYLMLTFGAEVWARLEKDTGLKAKYNYEDLIIKKKKLLIKVDNREQRPLTFLGHDTEFGTIKQGDYSIKDSKIVVDRKMLSDGLNTLSKGFDRFKRELARAEKAGEYLIMLIEEKFSNLESFEYLPHTKYTKTNKDFIFHRIRELLQEFNNFQVCCVDGRLQAAETIVNIFNLENDIHKIDLQYYIEKGLI